MISLEKSLNLSLLELLSVLLPGATGLYFLNRIDGVRQFVSEEFSNENEWAEGLMLFGAAYFLGYVIYVSSSFLDSWYDKIKRRALKLDTEENREKGLQMLPSEDYKIDNPIYRVLFPHLVDTHNLTVTIVKWKNDHVGVEFDGYKHQTIDAYQYSFRRLMAVKPAMFAEVERYHSTARFFRCMTLVLFAGAILLLIGERSWDISLWLLLFSLISLLIFLDRWRKANHVAFKNVIILQGLNDKKTS